MVLGRVFKRLHQHILGLRVRGKTGHLSNFLWPNSYMKNYTQYLLSCGVILQGMPAFIADDVYFDSHDYSIISIGNDVVISMGVTLLTHDYSIARGIEAIKGKLWVNDAKNTPYFLKPISIGDNCFIGAGSILLPGTNIGRDCIIGAHTVVKGNIPDDSVVIGNPGRIVAKTSEWAKRHLDLNDYNPLDVKY